MTKEHVIHGALIDETALTIDEFANACGVSTEWIVLHVEGGLLGRVDVSTHAWRFASAELLRAQRLLALKRE
jgi:hypothetical protein